MKLKILSDLKFSNFEKSVFLLLFVFLLSFTITAEKILSEPTFYDKKISHSDRAKDINLLIDYLENTYSGKYIYKTEYAALIESLNKYKNENPKPITIKRFEKDLKWIFWNFLDGHLNFGRIQYEKYRQQLVAPKKVTSHEFKTLNKKKILTFKIPTFIIPDESEFLELLDVLKKNIKSIDYLIFDLSHNGGGYMSYPYRIASIVWDTQYRKGKNIQYYPTPYKREFRITNQYSENLFKTYDQRNGLNEFNFFNYLPESQKNFTEVEKSNFEEDVNTIYDFTKKIDYKTPSYPEKIFIITDQHCASACEELLEALEFHPRVTHLGESTKGSVQFFAIGWLQLTHSQLVVNIPTGAIEYYDNRKIEKIGYKPVLNVTPGDSGLLETVYLYIEKNFK